MSRSMPRPSVSARSATKSDPGAEDEPEREAGVRELEAARDHPVEDVGGEHGQRGGEEGDGRREAEPEIGAPADEHGREVGAVARVAEPPRRRGRVDTTQPREQLGVDRQRHDERAVSDERGRHHGHPIRKRATKWAWDSDLAN